jgi:hypothetical protein
MVAAVEVRRKNGAFETGHRDHNTIIQREVLLKVDPFENQPGHFRRRLLQTCRSSN